jgi:hypothetical protein
MLCLRGRSAGLSLSAFPTRRRAVTRDGAIPNALAPERLAVEMVRHLNAGDLDGFRGVVAPVVQIRAVPSGAAVQLTAADVFARLTRLGPRQTLCAARVRATDTGARISLEVAWMSPSGACMCCLGTVELWCAGGQVTALALALDVDPALDGAAMPFTEPDRRAAVATGW